MDYKDFMAHMEEAELKRKNSPWYKRIPLDVGEFLWYRVVLKIPDLPHLIKWKYQTMTKGYCDNDIWGLNHFIVRKIRAPFHEFYVHQSEGGMSLPAEFTSDPAAWLLVLSKIDYAFDHTWREDNDPDYDFMLKSSPEERDIHFEKVREGFELFGRFLLHLWD